MVNTKSENKIIILYFLFKKKIFLTKSEQGRKMKGEKPTVGWVGVWEESSWHWLVFTMLPRHSDTTGKPSQLYLMVSVMLSNNINKKYLYFLKNATARYYKNKSQCNH